MLPTTDPIPAAAYVRYSSELQDELSIQGQLDEIRAFAAKNGYEVITVFADRAERGSSDSRPQFVEMQLAVKSPTCPFKAVIAWKSDRIARKYELAAGFRGFLRRRGISLLFVAEPNIEGPVGSLLSAVMDGMNEFYSANLGENVRRGMKTSVSRGFASGGTAPFGYRKIQVPGDNGKMKWKWEVDPLTAPIVRRIYEEYISGKGLISIANGLNADGIKSARGGQWHSGQIWATLFSQRDAYLGRLTYNKYSRKEPEPGSGTKKGNTRKERRDLSEWVIFENAHPAIITPEQGMAVDGIRQGKEPLSKELDRKKEIRILTGLLRCGVCGKKYVIARGKKDRKYYACSSSRWGTSCGNRYVRCEQTEDLVKSIICNRVDTMEEEILKAIEEEPKVLEPVELKDIATEKDEIRRKMGNLVDAISEGIIPKDLASERMKTFQNALERLSFEEKALRHHFEQKEASGAALAELGELPEGWKDNDEFLRAVLLALIDRIEITVSGILVHYKVPISPDLI